MSRFRDHALWVGGPPLTERRIAIVSSAGLFRRAPSRFAAAMPIIGSFPATSHGKTC